VYEALLVCITASEETSAGEQIEQVPGAQPVPAALSAVVSLTTSAASTTSTAQPVCNATMTAHDDGPSSASLGPVNTHSLTGDRHRATGVLLHELTEPPHRR